MTGALDLLPGFDPYAVAQEEMPRPAKHAKHAKILAALACLAGPPTFKTAPETPAAPSEADVETLPVTPAETESEIETLAEALLAAHIATPGCGIIDLERARVYHRGEALRRLDLCRRRAAEAVTGDDPERAAIMAEEAAPLAPTARHAEVVRGLRLAASPLAGVPGALICRLCARRIWTSPSWRGTAPPDLCGPCFWGGAA